MIELLVIMFVLLFILTIYLIIDYTKLRIIKFRPEGEIYWRIAFREEDMVKELDGRLAEVIMPEKPIIVRAFRLFWPPRSIDISLPLKNLVE